MSTDIEWTDEVWNPVVGCARVSPGCENCYAERVAHRGLSERHRGLTVAGKQGPRWTGEARFVPEALGKPLHWRKPRRVFVNSMSDLFHENITFAQIAAVFGVMAATPHLTYQVLTKRPARMLEFFRWMTATAPMASIDGRLVDLATIKALNQLLHDANVGEIAFGGAERWPLPNVWLGVSVEDQKRADERIPLLLQCPAALRFLSVEPLLGPVDLRHVDADRAGHESMCQIDTLTGRHTDMGRPCHTVERIDWVIVGGESGHGARPCDISWIRSVVDQARRAGVAVFVKQLGAAPVFHRHTTDDVPADHLRMSLDNGRWRLLGMRDRKGADPLEWPEDLRVQEFPEVRRG